MPKTLHLAQLVEAGACRDQRDLFGEGGTITIAKARRVAGQFDWSWAASHLLTSENLAKYNRATASAWAEYEYNRVMASVRAEYKYNRVLAATFVRLYRAQ